MRPGRPLIFRKGGSLADTRHKHVQMGEKPPASGRESSFHHSVQEGGAWARVHDVDVSLAK